MFSNFKINLDILKFKLLRNHLNKKFFTKTILIIKYLKINLNNKNLKITIKILNLNVKKKIHIIKVILKYI